MISDGNAVGNGGDYEDALSFAFDGKAIPARQNPPEPPLDENGVRSEFLSEGLRYLHALITLSNEGATLFSETRATSLGDGQLIAATELLRDFRDSPRLRVAQEVRLEGRNLVAVNETAGMTITIGLRRWNEITDRYESRLAKRLKGMIAAHEVLSLLGPGYETTGDYSVTAQALRFEEKITELWGTSTQSIAPLFPAVQRAEAELRIDETGERAARVFTGVFAGPTGRCLRGIRTGAALHRRRSILLLDEAGQPFAEADDQPARRNLYFLPEWLLESSGRHDEAMRCRNVGAVRSALPGAIRRARRSHSPLESTAQELSPAQMRAQQGK